LTFWLVERRVVLPKDDVGVEEEDETYGLAAAAAAVVAVVFLLGLVRAEVPVAVASPLEEW
jgi:hypothetical protein